MFEEYLGEEHRAILAMLRVVEEAFSREQRTSTEMAKEAMLTMMLNFIATKDHRGKIIGHLICDSTAVEAWEKPVNKKKDIAMSVEKKRKRWRPQKDEPRGEKKRKRLARQVSMRPGIALSEIDLPCAWGCKRKSQGNVS